MFREIRECDLTEGKLVELASFDPPAGDLYWNPLNLEDTEDDVAGDPDRYYAVGSDTGGGLHGLELSRTGTDGSDGGGEDRNLDLG